MRVALEISKTLIVQVKAKVSCGCADTGVCLCDPRECKCGPGCTQHCTEKAHLAKADRVFCPSYREARAHAAEQSKRLMVWVGGHCQPCVRELSDYLHVKVDDGYLDFKAGAVLIEGRNGEAWILKCWRGEYPSVEEVRSTRLVRGSNKLFVDQPTLSFSSPCTDGSCGMPMFFGPPAFSCGPMGCAGGACGPAFGPPPMFYGGFGGFGGFGGGGCAGGGCSSCAGGRCR